ncbi:hypothetical protein KP509_11G049800 [Ceratopteris richardii]|uniref:Uncharacterized protein n=1 Tax=Ceratopteris richardii TaxID=49495 RepID=A0A8T2TVC5_CERRI|nr:hypothetical protein KP509_11G049800 [Ceratopteris richardii]
MAGGRRRRKFAIVSETEDRLLQEQIKVAAAMLIAAAETAGISASRNDRQERGSTLISARPDNSRTFSLTEGASQGDFVYEDVNGDEDDDDEKYLVGFTEVNIVGLQYYHGTVNSREMVRLIREPHNVYDRNAIRVDNMYGEQVGHIERYKACHLAPLVDDGLILIEGIIPRGSKNAFRMPCQVYVFSKDTAMNTVRNRLSRSGLALVTPNDRNFEQLTAMGIPERLKLTEDKERGKNIDEIFDTLILNQKKVTTAIDPPPLLKTSLYPHQKEALAWLVERENSLELPPFWQEQAEKRGSTKKSYVNSLTNFMTDQRPEPFRGGILADEMGLGKTLTLLSLIATNKPFKSPSFGNDKDFGQPTSSRPLKRAKCDNPESQATGERRSGATLVVCPLSVMSIWISQLEEHTLPGSLKVYLYHGTDRTKKSSVLSSHDIVLTTYNILAAEGYDSRSPLQKVNWLRVILDEAHIVKNPNAGMSKAAFSLKAERRWAVTGTPIQNGAKDLGSLMMFLKLQPLDDKSFWNRTIQRPLSTGDASGFLRLQALLMAIALRRTKDMEVDNKRLVDLPRRTVNIHFVELDVKDRQLYDKIELEGKRLVGQYVASGTVLQNYSTILQIILRLRQICDHSDLCPLKEGLLDTISDIKDLSSSPELLQKLLSVLQSGDDFDCPICLSPPAIAVITKCSHVFCRKCIEKTLMQDKEKCPMCRVPLTTSDLFAASPTAEATDVEADIQKQVSSAKLKALMGLLLETRIKDPSIKSVVFSQFAGMLNLIQAPLKEAGFKYVRIDGSMSLKKREAALRAFQSKDTDGPTVILLSLKAAGVGLNLVAASQVYMIDPWWNPAIEEQAMDRVHRLGQTRDVEIVRLVVQDSIEERILELQEKKRNLASSAFGKSVDDMRRSRIEDVQHLMRI